MVQRPPTALFSADVILNGDSGGLCEAVIIVTNARLPLNIMTSLSSNPQTDGVLELLTAASNAIHPDYVKSCPFQRRPKRKNGRGPAYSQDRYLYDL